MYITHFLFGAWQYHFNEFRGVIDRERNGSTGKEMAQPGKQTPSEGAACPLCPSASYATGYMYVEAPWYKHR